MALIVEKRVHITSYTFFYLLFKFRRPGWDRRGGRSGETGKEWTTRTSRYKALIHLQSMTWFPGHLLGHKWSLNSKTRKRVQTFLCSPKTERKKERKAVQLNSPVKLLYSSTELYMSLFRIVLSWTLISNMLMRPVESEMELLGILQFLWTLHSLTLG